MYVVVSWLVGVFLLAGVLLSGAAVLGYRSIQSPSVNLFALTAAILGAGSFALAIGFVLERPVIILGIVIVLGMVVPLPWMLFSFDYIGMESLVGPAVASIVATPLGLGLVTTGIVFLDPLVGVYDLPQQSNATGMMAVVVTVLSLVQWFGLLYAGGLILAGGGVLLWTFQRYRHLDSTTGIVLLTFGVAPWLSLLFGLQLEPVSFLAFGGTTAVGFLVASFAALALVGPAALFDRVPAAGNIGPATVIQELADPVLVTDGQGTVVELNGAARETFGSMSAIGRNIDQLLGVPFDGLVDRNIVELESEAGRTLFEPTVSEPTDQHNNLLGYAVVLRDVTDIQTRRQRLEVLTRVLRHNLKNDMTVILGRADLIKDRNTDSVTTDSATAISKKGEQLVTLAEKARSAEQFLSAEFADTYETGLAELVETVFATVDAEHDAEYRHTIDSALVVGVPRDPLELILQNLVENAVVHNDGDPTVEVAAEYDPRRTYALRLTVSDNGPGIPEIERTVIEAGSETELQHASGIGLWVVRWITTSLSGKIAFEERNCGGTRVVLDLPVN